jgi:two-component system, OmpR family, sensor kinase
MFTHSIRWRLQLWLAFLLVCVLSGFGVTVYQLQRITQLSQLDEELNRRVAALNLAVRGGPPSEPGRRPPFDGGTGVRDDGRKRPPPPHGRPGGPPADDWAGARGGPREVAFSSDTASLFADERPDAFYFAVWSREGSVLRRSTNAPADLPLPAREGRDSSLHFRVRDKLREAYQFTELGDYVLTGRSLTADWQAQRHLGWMLLVAGSVVLALGLGGGWWLATRAIRPVEDISAAASRISAGNLSERIVASEPDNELGRLAGVLNNTFARLEAAFTQQKQFTADASHELRTPISVIISEAQTTLARGRTSAEYRDTIEANLAAAQQMRQLTENLLALARLDAKHESLKREKFDIAQKVRECIERIRPLSRERGIQIHCDLPPTECRGDRDRLGQVITNLLTNAIHYNHDGGEVRLATRAENDSVILTVSDTGIGIAAEDLPHIFGRFYRVDKSRSHSEGRSGLGLAISKAIVESHGGSIAVHSEFGIGTTLTVRLPTESTPS